MHIKRETNVLSVQMREEKTAFTTVLPFSINFMILI